jgi:uncharacterized protein (TIGR03000 family)
MLRRNLKKLTLGAAALTMAMVGGASQADAFWGHSSGGSWGGSYGGGYNGYASYGGSWGSYGGSSGGGWHGHHRHHHRRAYYSSGSYGGYGSSGGSYGSSGGWYAGYGSSGGSSGGWYAGYGSSGGSSGGSYGSWGSSGGTVIETPAAPATQTPPPPPVGAPSLEPGAPAPAPGEIPPEAPPADGSASLNSATLNVHVPADAKVFVNGLATKSVGADRRYVSNGLQRGYNYSYEIRAEFVKDGQAVTQTKVIKLQAGGASDVTFGPQAEDEQIAEQPVSTSLTLHVPADAKVYLSGNETRGAGEVRRFSTTKLAAGQQWQDYVVRVEVQRDGRTLSKEETVSLKGGDARELNVDFSAPQVAQTSVDRQ